MAVLLHRAVLKFLEIGAHLAELLVALLGEFISGEFAELIESFRKVAFDARSHLVVIAVSASKGFFDDIIDNAELWEVLACEPKDLGGFGGMLVAFPQNSCAAFGADNRVVSVLQHGDAVSYTDTKCTPRATFADHDANDGRLQLAHHEHALRNDLGLASLFGSNAGIGSRGIDEGDDREFVFFREFHFRHRFAVAFGVRAAEVASGAFFEGAAFLVADDEYFSPSEFGEAG